MVSTSVSLHACGFWKTMERQCCRLKESTDIHTYPTPVITTHFRIHLTLISFAFLIYVESVLDYVELQAIFT